MDAKTLQVWRTIARLIDEGLYTPTEQDIGRACGGMTDSTVHMHLRLLMEAGYVMKQTYRHRGVRLAKRPLLEQ